MKIPEELNDPNGWGAVGVGAIAHIDGKIWCKTNVGWEHIGDYGRLRSRSRIYDAIPRADVRMAEGKIDRETWQRWCDEAARGATKHTLIGWPTDDE